jgi:tRNA(adenine34) deaminase
MAKSRSPKRWISRVGTVSTYPPQGIFTRSAEEIARTMARPDVSPRGIGSAIRMVQYFINRSGRNLSAERRRALERAKRILQKMAQAERGR